MYTISVEAGFSALHSLRLPEGAVEPTHGHDWAVRAYFSTAELDATDMVLDFEQASGALEATLGERSSIVSRDTRRITTRSFR